MYALTRSLVRSPALRQGIQSMQVARPVTMRVVPATTTKSVEGYEEKNIRMGREMSPHLTIYKPQLTSLLSVTHRGTGVALSGFAWIFGLGALVSSHDVSHYITMVEGLQLSAASLAVLKFMIAYPLAYHSTNGVRHLVWDTGRFLKIKEVYSTGYVMVAVSFVLAAALACM